MKQKLPFKKKLAQNIHVKYVNTQAKLHDLTYFFWECTLRCNINCLHCGSDCRKDSAVKDMPADDFLKIASQVKEHFNPNKVMMVITGGEPLVRKDLEYVGIELYKMGFPWGFVTNGFALNSHRLNSLMNSGLRSVTVSLDGFEAEHDWIRGRNGSFNKAHNAISLIVKQKDLVYDVVTCVNQRNIDDLFDLKEMLVEMGVKKWRIFTIFPIGRAKDNEMLTLSNEQFVKVMDFIRKVRKEGKIQLSYGCEGYLGQYENEVRDGYSFCRAGINIASILADGSIGACPNINHSFVQGNIYKDDFIEIWNTKYELYRNREWMNCNTCEDCEVFKYCRGNGMHLRDPEKNDVIKCHYQMINKA